MNIKKDSDLVCACLVQEIRNSTVFHNVFEAAMAIRHVRSIARDMIDELDRTQFKDNRKSIAYNLGQAISGTDDRWANIPEHTKDSECKNRD